MQAFIVDKIVNIALFMENERIFPFLFSIGNGLEIYSSSRNDACAEIVIPSDLIAFPQLEEVYLPWESPVPWLQSLLNKSPNVKVLNINMADNFAGINILSLREFKVSSVVAESPAASAHAISSFAGSPLCSSLESLDLKYALILNSTGMKALTMMKNLKVLKMPNLYCTENNLLFLLRQLTHLEVLVLLRHTYPAAASYFGRSSFFFHALFAEFDFKKQLCITVDLLQSSVNDKALAECFPTTFHKAAQTTEFSVGFPMYYYSHSQLQALTASFMAMLVSGRFANLQVLNLYDMLVSLDDYFVGIRDCCPKLEGLFWLNHVSNTSTALTIDSFPQGWRHLMHVRLDGVKINMAVARQIAGCSSKMCFFYCVKGLKLERGESTESVKDAMEQEFPEIDLYF